MNNDLITDSEYNWEDGWDDTYEVVCDFVDSIGEIL